MGIRSNISTANTFKVRLHFFATNIARYSSEGVGSFSRHFRQCVATLAFLFFQSSIFQVVGVCSTQGLITPDDDVSVVECTSAKPESC